MAETTLEISDFAPQAKTTLDTDGDYLVLAILLVIIVLAVFGWEYYRDFKKRRRRRRFISRLSAAR